MTKFTIECDSFEELLSVAMLIAAGQVPAPTVEAAPTEKPKKKTVAKVEAEPEPEPVAEDKPSIDFDTVRERLSALTLQGKNVKDLLTQFGVNRISQIPKEQYAELMQAAEAL